ncbi:MAG TPA: SEC-C domain-containing protein [Polyangia bacterium]|nr:SEC-C domain-containing protein [Polyangia bacterium]
MSLVPRNAPCPCGSGIKYKKCCLSREARAGERGLASRERIIDGPTRSFATSREGKPGRLPDADAWPVERVYVPVSDVWRATGMGTVAIARRRPDGRLAYGAFLLKLSEHGISGAFGKADAAAGARDFLDDLLDMIPPMEEGSLADASVFVYGAMALAATQNAGFPPDELGPCLDLLPPPPGGAEQWLEALVGLGGRTAAGLMRIIADLPADADIDDRKEIAVGTEMEFELPAGGAVHTSASARFPRIGDQGGASRFHYTPIPIWKRSKHGTPGKVQGEVQVRGVRLVAIALTLSMAARLIADLREWLGPRITLASVRWVNSVTGRSESVSIDRGSLFEGRGAADVLFPRLLGG